MEKNIGKSLEAFSRKFHLKIAKFQILPIKALAGRFFKQFSTANLNSFQRIYLLKFCTFVNDDTQDMW